MFQGFLYYISIPIKISVIALVSSLNKLSIILLWDNVTYPEKFPDYATLQQEYRAILDDIRLDKTPHGYVYHMENRDHLPLRHAALMWSNPQIGYVNAIEEFIHLGEFVRHRGSTKQTPPMVPISVSFILSVAIRNNIRIHQLTKQIYIDAVDKLIGNGFKLSGYKGATRSVLSTSFDYVYVASVLKTAYAITKDYKYKRELEKYNYLRPLLIAPLTYFLNRRYFLDHIYMLALYTMCQLDKNALEIHAMKWVYNESSLQTNPFFGALAKEQGIKVSKQILFSHSNSSPLKASDLHLTKYVKQYPINWQNSNHNEFKFDDLIGFPIPDGEFQYTNYLDGVTLAKSLISLLD